MHITNFIRNVEFVFLRLVVSIITGYHGETRCLVPGEGVPWGTVNPKQSTNVPSMALPDLLHLVAVHADKSGDLDLLPGACVHNAVSLLQGALVHTQVCQLTVLARLERQRGEGRMKLVLDLRSLYVRDKEGEVRHLLGKGSLQTCLVHVWEKVRLAW